MSSSKLVQSFNALPQTQMVPSGLVPNEWHFDLRYVHLEPTPSHVLAIIQPESLYFHMERLPIGLANGSSGIAFFPESAKEAAPEVAKALLHMFVQSLGEIPEEMRASMGSQTSITFQAPWRLTTEDRGLAAAVGTEFKRLGVRHDTLFKIGVSTNSVNKIMQESFENLFHGLKKAIGIQDYVSPFISIPTSIVYHRLDPPPRPVPEESEFELALKYAQELQKSRPPMENENDSSVAVMEEIQAVLKLIAEKPAKVVKAEADAGNPESAFDYGLRLLLGLGCEYDRTLSRVYIFKALSSPKASDKLKCTAHCTLIDWYMSASATQLISRYLFASCHHANIAASLCRRVSPPGTRASPAVLWFMSRVFGPHTNDKPELLYFFKDAWKAWQDRNAQMASGRERMEEKRLKNPNRYRCATVGCGIEADAGKMLSKCAGKCDADKKPSYCSKACQKADWKNHKPFCKPGAPCSVIDPAIDSSRVGGPSSKQGAIQVPLTQGDGSTMLLSSSTIDPKMLKEVRDHIARAQGIDGRPSAFPSPSLTLELERLN